MKERENFHLKTDKWCKLCNATLKLTFNNNFEYDWLT